MLTTIKEPIACSIDQRFDVVIFREMMMPAVYAVGKLRRLCQKVMKEAGIIGWREQLSTRKPPAIITGKLVPAQH